MAGPVVGGDRVVLTSPLSYRGDSDNVATPVGGIGAVGTALAVNSGAVRVEWDDGQDLFCDETCLTPLAAYLPPSLDRAVVEAWLDT